MVGSQAAGHGQSTCPGSTRTSVPSLPLASPRRRRASGRPGHLLRTASAYRTAQLLSIASQVGAADAAREAQQQRFTDLMRRWTQIDGCAARNAFCFGFDPDWKGIVGQTPAFGSELFNDHHFHYGYFLYAAGVLAAHDPSVIEDLRPVMTLLAADIAGSADTGITPQWRPYDAYASHSWAAGTSEFADGNNQESSSEAVTAWAGLQLWAQAAKDPALEREAAWLLGSEAHAATTYWTNLDTTNPVYDGFEHGVMGINWGGKRDYATWFSAEPSAILGIQLIPMSPSSGYLAGDPDRIRTNVQEGGSGPLADYALMYAGLAGPEDARTALEQARDLKDDGIDQGNSRSYMLAYLDAAHQPRLNPGCLHQTRLSHDRVRLATRITTRARSRRPVDAWCVLLGGMGASPDSSSGHGSSRGTCAQGILDAGREEQSDRHRQFSVFGHQMRFDLAEGFPLVTTNRVRTRRCSVRRAAVVLRGDTNVEWLQDRPRHHLGRVGRRRRRPRSGLRLPVVIVADARRPGLGWVWWSGSD